MSEPQGRPTRPTETPERQTRRAWWVFTASFFVLGLIALLRLGIETARPIDYAVVGLVVVVGFAAIRHRQAVATLEVGRREEAESFARILSEPVPIGLARRASSARSSPSSRAPPARTTSSSPDAARTRGCWRRRWSAPAPASPIRAPVSRSRPSRIRSPRPESAIREPVAIPVVSEVADPVAAGGLRGRFDDITTRLAATTPMARPAKAGEIGPRVPGEHELVAERIAARAGEAYGLANTLAAPLTSGGDVIGAIVLSHRTAGLWSPTTRRLLNGAAMEASSALSRAYSHQAAEAQASTDALTGLPNRRYFEEFCGLLARRRRSGDAVGVLMIDIDRFKVLNDTHGHATGDEVLRAVGGAIVGAVREDDVPARYGGEEFVVLLRNPSPEVALEVGERVRVSVAALDLRRLQVGGVSVSVGVAVADEADQPIVDVIARADRALYRAKRAGRDRVVAA